MSNAAQLLLKRNRARESLIEFIKFTFPKYQVNWHHELICNEIDNLLNHDYDLLLVSTPPRMGKSEIVSRRLPAYVLGRNPDASIIACSYGADLASQMNRAVQKVIDSPEYTQVFPDTRLNASNVRTTAQGTFLRNSDLFEIVNHKGVYRSCGIGGGITGLGFSGCGIIDDPVKNRQESESKTYRDKIFEWWTSVFYSRRENNAPILITMTRWNQADLAGQILDMAEREEGTDRVKVITLSALSEEVRPEYDQRTGPNQSLWPDKFPVEILQTIKATVPVYTWLSLYQQRPSAAEGNIFKRESFRYASISGDILDLGEKKVSIRKCKIFQTCDPAASTKSSADFFALGTWAQTDDNDLVLLDMLRTRLEGPDQIKLLKQQYERWRPIYQAVEAVGVGKTLFQMLVREGLPVKELKADSDKLTRALPAAARLEAGTVYFTKGAWLNDFEEELLSFPNGAHDDATDCFSYAVALIVSKANMGNFDLSKMFSKKSHSGTLSRNSGTIFY